LVNKSAMAEPVPHLHLAELTASQFMDVWRHFDSDGNGFIEGQELEDFLEELESARKGVNPVNASLRMKISDFMQKFDQNSDGKIEMLEVNNSRVHRPLPVITSYCFQWRDVESAFCREQTRHTVNTLIWFHVSLYFYGQNLKMFDLNGDGKLGLSEMARLLPVQENFLLKFQSFKLSSDEFSAIFMYYDKDGNGYIDEHELDALLKDLYKKHNMDFDSQTLASSKKSIMALSDGGKLFRTELEIVLCKEPSN
uniref:Calbindin 2b n=1 Tax=Astyanax mexicanus TaxID=7994 RepID=A0A8B9HW81_ASTMX